MDCASLSTAVKGAASSCVLLLPRWWHDPYKLPPVVHVAPALIAAGAAPAARSLVEATFASRMLEVDNNFSSISSVGDNCGPVTIVARWVLTAVPNVVASAKLRGGQAPPGHQAGAGDPSPLVSGGGPVPPETSAPSSLSLLPSLTPAGLLLRTQSSSLRELSFVGIDSHAWSALRAVCERVGPMSLRSLDVAGITGEVLPEPSRRHFLIALAHCRGLTSLSVARSFPLSHFVPGMNTPSAERESRSKHSANFAALAAAAVAAFGPTVRTLKCYLRDAADVRSVAALPAALPQLCSLTMWDPVRVDRSRPTRAAIAAILPMLTSLNITDSLGSAASAYAVEVLAGVSQLATPILPLQTLRAACCGELVPFLQLLHPSAAPALTEIDFVGTHLTPEVAVALAKLTHCTSLSMGVCPLDDARLHQLLASMPQLRRLSLVDSNRFDGDNYPQWAARQLDVGASSSEDRSQQPQPRLKHQALCSNVRLLSGVGGSLWQRLVFPRAKLDPKHYETMALGDLTSALGRG